jgi:hypothetical protein
MLGHALAEVIAAAVDLGAGICVRIGNEGRLADIAERYDLRCVAV